MATIPELEPFIQQLDESWFRLYVRNVSMLRLDVIHPVVSGNKWYKLKQNIQHALDNGYKTIITFGGPFSNHLIATAAATQAFGIKAIGIVRGQYAQSELTPTLSDCVQLGIELQFVSREEYAKKEDTVWLQQLYSKYDKPFIIPEGGANELGRLGAEDIAQYIPKQFTHVCVSVGTGTTLIGIRNALPTTQQVWGYAPMRNGSYLSDEIAQHLTSQKNVAWQLFSDWHFGGFGKWNDELLTFMDSFNKTNHITLDKVYTAKMMYGIQQQLQQNIFPGDAEILCIHTGGLQGNRT
jgi:1-aminocyclopropane-1-carboxylate deaminase